MSEITFVASPARAEPPYEPLMDSRLLPFVVARDGTQADVCLATLLEQHALPIIARIAGRGHDAEDLRREILAQVVVLLRDCKAAPTILPIANFSHCVAVLAKNICRAHQRRWSWPRRSLKSSLRHTLTHDLQFALWGDAAHMSVCGFLHWLGTPPRTSDKLRQLLVQPHILNEVVGGAAQRLPCDELLRAVFHWVGHPIQFDALLEIVAALQSGNDEAPTHAPEGETASRAFLARLWGELEQLPPLQRLAYLLRLPSAELALFWFYGIVSLRQIGKTLQLTNEQFQRAWVLLEWSETGREQARALTSYDEKFAMLWPHLPLNDLTIAALLETAPQNVSALRQAACRALRQRVSVSLTARS